MKLRTFALLLILAALVGYAHGADTRCRVFDGPPFPCQATYTTDALTPTLRILERPIFADGFE